MKVSALSDALQSVEDGGMLTTDEESNGSVRSSYDGRKVDFQFESWKMMEKLDPFDGSVLDGIFFFEGNSMPKAFNFH